MRRPKSRFLHSPSKDDVAMFPRARADRLATVRCWCHKMDRWWASKNGDNHTLFRWTTPSETRFVRACASLFPLQTRTLFKKKKRWAGHTKTKPWPNATTAGTAVCGSLRYASLCATRAWNVTGAKLLFRADRSRHASALVRLLTNLKNSYFPTSVMSICAPTAQPPTTHKKITHATKN